MRHKTAKTVARLCGIALPSMIVGKCLAFDLTIDTGQRGAGPLELAAILTLISLAPAILIMLTSLHSHSNRFVVVTSGSRASTDAAKHGDHRIGHVSDGIGDGAHMATYSGERT